MSWNLGYSRIENTINDDRTIPDDGGVEELLERRFENERFDRAVAGAGYTFGARTAPNQPSKVPLRRDDHPPRATRGGPDEGELP